jgi:di/tricarboxylate transporter
MTMVGSSPLILLNDLILTSNTALPAEQQMQPWGLFSVTPVGAALIITGISYFVIAGRFVLPKTESESSPSGSDSMRYFKDIYDVNYSLCELVVTNDSPLIGKLLDDVESAYCIRIIATKHKSNGRRIGPGALARDTEISSGMVLGVIADPEDIEHFVEKYELKQLTGLNNFSEDLSASKAGVAEVVIPPGSSLIGNVMSGCVKPMDWH